MNVKSKRVFVLGLLLAFTVQSSPTVNHPSTGLNPDLMHTTSPSIGLRPQQKPQKLTNQPQAAPLKRKLSTDEEGEPGTPETSEGQDYEASDAEADDSAYEYHDSEASADEETIGMDDLADEYEQIKTAVQFVEYKLTEMNELIKECIDSEIAENLIIEKEKLLTECAGMGFQILIENYKSNMKRIKHIFLDIIKKRTSVLDIEYEDEIEFFLDTLEDFINKDFKIKESLMIAQEAAKFYVSPQFFKDLLMIAEPELKALNAIHMRMHENKKELQDYINLKIADRRSFVESVEAVKAAEAESAPPAPEAPEAHKKESSEEEEEEEGSEGSESSEEESEESEEESGESEEGEEEESDEGENEGEEGEEPEDEGNHGAGDKGEDGDGENKGEKGGEQSNSGGEKSGGEGGAEKDSEGGAETSSGGGD